MSAIVKNAYLSLSPHFRSKFRGRFTAIISEIVVLEELKKQGFQATLKSGQGSYDLLVNKIKKIEVKACNRDNTWVKRKGGVNPGCTGIKPSKFDNLVYVEFDDTLSGFDFFIFTDQEAATFPYKHQEKMWYAKNYRESDSRTLNNPFSMQFLNISQVLANHLNTVLQSSQGAWHKI